MEPLKKTINGMEYTFLAMPYNPAHRIYRKMHGYVAPLLEPLAHLVAKVGDGGALEKILDDEGSLGALQKLTSHIGGLIADDDFAGLVDTMLKYVLASGAELSPSHFSMPGADDGKGRLADYDQVVIWAVWVYFGRPFFEGLGVSGTKAAQLGDRLRTLST